MIDAMEEVFAPAPVPKWLVDFDRDPAAAVDAALWGRYYFADLNVADPAELLIDWAAALGGHEDFIRRLDQAVADWVWSTWGTPPDAGARRSPASVAVAWVRAADVVAAVRALHQSGRALRAHFADRDPYLGPLSTGPARDPLGRYLYAVAQHQADPSLVPVWWDYCDLEPGIAWHHGANGIWGLRGVPAASAAERGRFPKAVALGLARMGIGLNRRSRQGALRPADARAEFERVFHLTLASYPFPERWREYWSEAAGDLRIPYEVEKWMRALLPPRAEAVPAAGQAVAAGGLGVREQWAARAKSFEEALRKGRTSVIPQIDKLLREERSYARNTGNAFPLTRSLLGFARALARKNPTQALEWAGEAHAWEPSNSFCWTTYLSVAQWHPAVPAESLLPMAWDAFDRFPEDRVVRSELARTLRRAGRIEEAVQVYRELMERFPDDEKVYTELAEILKEAGRLHDAETVYREGQRRFGTNKVLLSGLVTLLLDMERPEEAEPLSLLAMERFPADEVSQSQPAEVYRRMGRLREAERIYRSVMERFPDDVLAPVALVDILLSSRRLEEAEEVCRQAVERFGQNPAPLMALSRILRLRGETGLPQALEYAERALELSPGDTHAIMEKARVFELMGRQEEANTLLEEARRAPAGRGGSEGEEAISHPVPAPVDAPAGQAPAAAQGPAHDPWRVRHASMAVCAHARFLRRWARSSEAGDGARAPEALRQQAIRMLTELIEREPYNGRARTELSLLHLESGDAAEARRLLEESAALLPGSTGIQYALARVDREVARREKARLDYDNVDAVPALWRRLQKMNPDYGPLERLGEARAWLARTDGDIVTGKAQRSLSELRTWMRPHLTLDVASREPRTDDPGAVRSRYRIRDGFYPWWSREVQAFVFGPLDITAEFAPGDVAVVAERLQAFDGAINGLEEDFTAHLMAF